ncbi:hypothetical protein ABIB95_005643 [Bradyrhizobium sp. LA2.1]
MDPVPVPPRHCGPEGEAGIALVQKRGRRGQAGRRTTAEICGASRRHTGGLDIPVASVDRTAGAVISDQSAGIGGAAAGKLAGRIGLNDRAVIVPDQPSHIGTASYVAGRIDVGRGGICAEIPDQAPDVRRAPDAPLCVGIADCAEVVDVAGEPTDTTAASRDDAGRKRRGHERVAGVAQQPPDGIIADDRTVRISVIDGGGIRSPNQSPDRIIADDRCIAQADVANDDRAVGIAEQTDIIF